MNFETIIGIEIHLQLKTKTKMFSPAQNVSNAAPNTHVHPIDMGFPGVLPRVNKKAVELALIACQALHCEIDTLLCFDRKNYFYADLPKGYQITQDKRPIGKNGYLLIDVDQQEKKIEIERIHLEEDTAKQLHFDTYTLLDYNRCGVPLIEIVTKPNIRSGKEAAAYVEQLKNTLLYLDVSDCKMEDGSLRCDVNVSIRPYGQKEYGTKVEIKNLNSISNVEKAIDYEVKRQKALFLKNQTIDMETRRFDEQSKTTVLMRKKTSAVDYKYFTEDNIVPIQLDVNWVHQVITNLPELPHQKMIRYQKEYGLSNYDARVLTSNKELAHYFEATIAHYSNYKLIANWLMVETLGYVNKNNILLKNIKMKPQDLAKLVQLIDGGKISSKQAKNVFEQLMQKEQSVEEIIQKMNIVQINDSNQINEWIQQVLQEFPASVSDYQAGKDRAFGFMIGQIMKRSKGQANPVLTNQLLKKALDELK